MTSWRGRWSFEQSALSLSAELTHSGRVCRGVAGPLGTMTHNQFLVMD